MKIALVLFGQPRGILNSSVFDSHKKYILDKYDTDVYCHMWYSDSETKFVASSFVPSNSDLSIIKNSPDIICSRYNPKKVHIDTPRTFEFSEEIQNILDISYKGGWYNKLHYSNYLSQLFSIESAIKLCDNIEKYDFIILTRYDIVIDSFPDLNKLDKNIFYVDQLESGKFNSVLDYRDMVNIFNPKFIRSQYFYTNVETAIKTYIGTSNFNEPSVECLKYNCFLLYHTKEELQKIQLLRHRI
jgi:hypothetical protein